MKRIICFITSLSSGGAEHQLSELATLLEKKQYKIILATFADVNDHYILPKSIERFHIGKGKNKVGKFLSIFKFFIQAKVDCIISFGQRENLLVLIPMLFRPLIKVIVGERNFTFGDQSRIEKILFNFLYRRANYIVPNSYSQQSHILKLKPEYKRKVVTITNYTDIDKYYPKNYKSIGITRIGIFCRYHKQKNYERFAYAVKMIKEQTDIPFVINWYGNQTFKDSCINPDYLKLKQIVKELNIKDVFKLNNHITNVEEVMNQLDAFCLPSLYEGFSNSLSEAICCGKPVLVSDVSDNGVMVRNGINGFLFNPMNVDDIASAILKFLNLTENEREQMGIKSREIAITLFNKNHFLDNYIKLINN